MTDTLLVIGAASAVLFVAILLIEGALRPDYDPTYSTGSELSLGERGWIQIANFLQFGVAMLVFAVGVNRSLNAPAGAVLLVIFGLGFIAAGVFVTDPIRGYPPGTPAWTPAEATLRHKLHSVIGGPIAFFALFGACVALAGHLGGFWRLYTVLTAVVGLALTIWTGLAYQREAANLGLVQRALILVYFSWIVLLGIHLV